VGIRKNQRSNIGIKKYSRALWAAFASVCLGFVGRSSPAAELDAFDGRLESDESHALTYTWGLEYRAPIGGHFDAGFVWLNEGHLPNNHRDGQSVQLWWFSKKDPLGLVFQVGAGPYRYYDTHSLTPDPDFHDAHGWGALGSVSADYYFANHWFTFLRANQVSASDKYASSSVAFGVGYQFSSKLDLSLDGGDGAEQAARLWEIDGLLGERIANTSHSETGASEAVAVRRMFSEHFSASITYIGGQDTLLEWRDGVAAQLWLEQRLTSRFSVGVGAGAFIVSEDDSLRNTNVGPPSNLAAVVSVTLAYAWTPRWVSRVIWDRIGTGDDHDCDIVHIGVGYRF